MLAVLEAAKSEIEAARDYLTQQSPDLGDRFIEEISGALSAIEQRPLSFARVETLKSNRAYRRALLPTFPYLVIFRLVDESAVVVAVAHSHRRPNYWARRR
jgi:plasmid stabilization system protein ParE